jgi:hypothetical protein
MEGKQLPDGRYQRPTVALVCNFPPPAPGKPSLLSHSEVETLFHEFGHALQHMLTTVDEPDASGVNGIEWDAVEVASQFMENWCYDRAVLQQMTAHVETDLPLPDDLFNKIVASKNYRSASAMLRQLIFATVDMPGPHGWKEGSLIASTHWLRAKLYNDTTAFPLDLEPLRANATNFNLKAVDCGLDPVAARVTPTGQVRDLPGNRTVYDLMRDELVRCPKPVFTDPQEKKAIVQRCLGIDDATITPLTAQLVSQTDHDQWTAFRYAFTPMQGTLTNAIPALLVVPKTITAAPRMVLSDCGKSNTVDLIQHGLQSGSPVLAIDLFATGEVGALKHPFYGSKRADEGISVMLYLLGRSMVEVRTREIVACTAWLAERYQKPVQIITRGSAAIPAYHAYALLPERIQSITTETPPLAWREVVQKSDKYAFANCVHKALRSYDWVDLYK